MLKERFVDFINQSIRENWETKALADYNGESYTYADVASNIVAIHKLYQSIGIKKGDKIALIGRNSARWCIVYLATVNYGAVIVPILPDFKPEDMQEIINHSDAVLLFCDDVIYQGFNSEKIPAIKLTMSLNTFQYIHSTVEHTKGLVNSTDISKVEKIDIESYQPPTIDNKELAVISYTSGTTGHSKGVILSHNSLAANIRYAKNNMPLKAGSPIVSFLPLAHAYGCAFEFLFPFSIGCAVTILTKTPSPQIIMKAFKEIKPALVLSVPLVIEKIYKKQVIPVVQKPVVRLLMAIPILNKLIFYKIRKKLVDAFGGAFTEIVIGGAALNPEAEAFFRKIKFPYTVGYGMTECGPLISYASSAIAREGSSGKPVDTLEVKIDSSDPVNEVGEIILRGDNVMLGYYKNDEATKEIIDADGWLHTGDLGLIDEDGFVFIKGRSKSLILGSNGKNIYPEEIESILNNRFGVMESVVVLRNGNLLALIYPDIDSLGKSHDVEVQLKDLMESHIKEVNNSLPKYMKLAGYELVDQEFVKTPKRSIKRFLYN